MHYQPEKVILQADIPFADCKLWQLQKEFFSREGIKAWAKQVPFYITSNPYIAHAYAQVIIRFMQDCLQQNKYQPNTPFYILELGAGTGCFSFYLLKQLLALQETLALTQLKFVYVISDFHAELVAGWQQHPALEEFIAKGVLDFAVYDLEAEQPISLLRANTVLQPALNPLIVIANYIFDSISNHLFYMQQGQLQEALATLTVPADKTVNGQVPDLEDIKVSLAYMPVAEPVYADPALSGILTDYLQEYRQGYFTFPIGGLRCLRHLQELSRNNLLVLASDKGYAATMQYYLNNKPQVVFHGSFSLMVNFDALGRYAKNCGGDYYVQPTKQHIITSALVFGNSLSNLPETRQALITHASQFGPGHLYEIYRFIKENNSGCSLETLLAELSMTHYDPHVFNQCLDAILNSLTEANLNQRHALLYSLPLLAANYYHLPGMDNTLFNIGQVYQELAWYEQALDYYQRSLAYVEPDGEFYFNVGLCYYHLQQYNAAADTFSRLIALEP